MDPPSADSAVTQRLLEQARAGEQAARALLVARHRAFLRRIISLRIDPGIRARIDASDLVQEVQIEVLRRLDAYLAKPAAPFRLWLRGLARERALQQRKHHRVTLKRSVEREVHLPEDTSVELGKALLSSSPGPAEQLLREELALRVHQALDLLPER